VRCDGSTPDHSCDGSGHICDSVWSCAAVEPGLAPVGKPVVALRSCCHLRGPGSPGPSSDRAGGRYRPRSMRWTRGAVCCLENPQRTPCYRCRYGYLLALQARWRMTRYLGVVPCGRCSGHRCTCAVWKSVSVSSRESRRNPWALHLVPGQDEEASGSLRRGQPQDRAQPAAGAQGWQGAI